MMETPDYQFKSPELLAKIATALLFGNVVVLMVWAFTALQLGGAIDQVVATSEGFEAVQRYGESFDELSRLWLFAYIPAACGFLPWFARMYGNIAAFGPVSVDHRGAHAVWAWLIPLVNLVRPYQIAQEIWTGSTNEGPTIEQARDSGLVKAWWLLFLVSGFAGSILLRGEPQTPAEFSSYLNRFSVWAVMRLGAAILAMLVIRSLTKRQVEAARHVAHARVVK